MPKLHQVKQDILDGYSHERLRYLKEIHKINGGRNIILYYSGWLQKPQFAGMTGIMDLDKNSFMAVIHGMDRSAGLDLILHTPGGEIAATESLIDYLYRMFEDNIRVIVPQLAMSAGTMIACAAKSIVMGKHSSLGPIDPQISNGMAAHGIVEEFKRAYEEIKKDGHKAALWQPIIAKYPPTFIGECEKAIAWADEIVMSRLLNGMLKDDDENKQKAKRIVNLLGNHALTKCHGRQLSAEYCKDAGLAVENLEENQKMQDAVLSLHHVCMLDLEQGPWLKIISNHDGVSVRPEAPKINR